MEEFKARRAAIKAALARLEELAAAGNLAEEVLEPVRRMYRERLRHVSIAVMKTRHARNWFAIAMPSSTADRPEREHINATYRKGELQDDARRRVERELDLREAHLASVGGQESS